ncbi:MAG: pseudouridine synthase [Anaerolineae bacterium]|jgi:23S rRNA pseudouridine2605 synthase|nr:pseudouridine synthase [Anaerolineae bacterium]
MTEERIQKILARAGYGSRRSCEELITAGRVRVDGTVAVLGQKADPDRQVITVDGERVKSPDQFVYLALNKPRGVLSDTEDARGRRTVLDLVPHEGHLFAVGRLDLTSEGLVLLTNDGDLANRLLHPRYGHEREYRVRVAGRPTEDVIRAWSRGIVLDGVKTRPAQVKVLKSEGSDTWLQVIMQEGKKRQIRRIAAALGHPVRALVRVRIGPVRLGRLAPGEWRPLTPKEVAALRKAASAEGPQEKNRQAAPQPKRRRGPGNRSV